MSVHRLESGSTGKYQHSVSGAPSGCALGNSLDLMLVFPCTLVDVQTQYSPPLVYVQTQYHTLD